MSDLIRGNFKTIKNIKDDKKSEDVNDLENEFEKAALNKLGGSIAYVSQKRILWEEKENLLGNTTKQKKDK